MALDLRLVRCEILLSDGRIPGALVVLFPLPRLVTDASVRQQYSLVAEFLRALSFSACHLRNVVLQLSQIGRDSFVLELLLNLPLLFESIPAQLLFLNERLKVLLLVLRRARPRLLDCVESKLDFGLRVVNGRWNSCVPSENLPPLLQRRLRPVLDLRLKFHRILSAYLCLHVL